MKQDLTKQEKAIQCAKNTEASVLILGATGTGKSTLAAKIHQEGRRAKKPFVSVNLASLHEGTIESFLFGHEKGAFTGADRRKIGSFELAHGGTLFLDEIGELSLPLQARLLEFLQTQRITRLGSTESIGINVRVICATHRDLEKRVQEGKFREDLLHRIRVLTIEMPRLVDIPDSFDEIVHRLIEELSQKYEKKILKLSEEVAELLENYSWPGNFRELHNVLECAVLSVQSTEIQKEDLPSWFLKQMRVDCKKHSGKKEEGGVNEWERISIFPLSRVLPSAWDAAEVPLYFDYLKTMKTFEAAFLRYVLEKNGGRLSQSARNLRMNKTTLFRRVRDLELRSELI